MPMYGMSLIVSSKTAFPDLHAEHALGEHRFVASSEPDRCTGEHVDMLLVIDQRAVPQARLLAIRKCSSTSRLSLTYILPGLLLQCSHGTGGSLKASGVLH
jgi:hypothetical protein